MRSYTIPLTVSVLAMALAIAAPLPVPPASAPIFWFVRSGQSLSIGAVGYCSSTGYPTCSSGAAYGSLTLFTPGQFYPPADTQFRTLAGHAYQNSPPAIESSATSMCNQYAALSGRICGTSDYGWPGAAYVSLAKGASCTSPNCYFDNSIGAGGAPPHTGVVQAAALAAAQGQSLYVPAVYFNQGESELGSSVTAAGYEAYMVQLQADYQDSIHSAIGQTGVIPLFIAQKSSWASWSGSTPRATPTNLAGADGVPVGQLQACLDHYSDGTIFCVGPEYHTTYTADGVHKLAGSYQAHGAREGKALFRVTAQKKGWRPFYPKSISVSGNLITVQFWVPFGALALDTTHITPLPNGNMGFEFTDTGGSGVTMPNNSVALKNGTNDSVTITLSGSPTGSFELRYAWTSPNGACPGSCSTAGSSYAGPMNGPRGNVADTDDRTSWTGDALTDYALSFRIPGISATAPYSWNPPEPNLTSLAGPATPLLFPLPSPLRRKR